MPASKRDLIAADDDASTIDDATDRLVTLIRHLLYATIEHDTDAALEIIRRCIDRALPGTTNDDLLAALARIMASTGCTKTMLH
jgi:hypothetical protein